MIHSVTDKPIFLSTTDTVPALAGRAVIRSDVAWSAGAETMQAAHVSLTAWARGNGFDAIVGLRFEIVPNVTGKIQTALSGPLGNNTFTNTSGWTSTGFTFYAYGTAIQYQA